MLVALHIKKGEMRPVRLVHNDRYASRVAQSHSGSQVSARTLIGWRYQKHGGRLSIIIYIETKCAETVEMTLVITVNPVLWRTVGKGLEWF